MTVDMIVVCDNIGQGNTFLGDANVQAEGTPQVLALDSRRSKDAAEGEKQGKMMMNHELCHLHRNHHFLGRVSLLSLLPPGRVGRGCSTTRGPTNAKHIEVARATQS